MIRLGAEQHERWSKNYAKASAASLLCLALAWVFGSTFERPISEVHGDGPSWELILVAIMGILVVAICFGSAASLFHYGMYRRKFQDES